MSSLSEYWARPKAGKNPCPPREENSDYNFLEIYFIVIVGARRIGLRLQDPQPCVLPLYYAPIIKTFK